MIGTVGVETDMYFKKKLGIGWNRCITGQEKKRMTPMV